MSMPFTPIEGLKGGLGATPLNMNILNMEQAKPESETGGANFQNMFLSALDKANSTMQTAGDMGQKLATGELKNIHEMTIAGAKAEIMLHLTTQIASKVSSACTTLFQMQL
jgi:flagellar hook-basal body complex protein FliE